MFKKMPKYSARKINQLNFKLICRPFSPPHDETGVVLSVAFFYSLCGLGIVGNTVIIATIIWSPKLQ